MEKIKNFFKNLFIRFESVLLFILRCVIIGCVVGLLVSLFVLHIEKNENTVTASAVTQGTAPFPTPEDLTNTRWFFSAVNLTGSINTWDIYGSFSWDNSSYNNNNTNFSRVRLYDDGRIIFWTDVTSAQNLSNLSAIYQPNTATWQIYAGLDNDNEGILVATTDYLVFTFTGGGSIDSSGFRSLIVNTGAYLPDYSMYIYSNGTVYIYDTSAITYYGDLALAYPDDFSYLHDATIPALTDLGLVPIMHYPTDTILLQNDISGSVPDDVSNVALGSYEFRPWANGRVNTISVSSLRRYIMNIYNLGASDADSFNPMTTISSMVTSVLQLEIFPNFRLYYIILIGFGIGLLAFFERMFLG